MVFARDGYLNAKIGDIAAEAGRSAASFYNYYDTKADLLIALAEEFHDEATSLAMLPFRAGLAGPEALREAVAGFWRTYAKRRGELIGIFQAAMVEGSFHDRWLELRGEAIRRIAGEVTAGAGAGLLPGCRSGHDGLGTVGHARALLLHLAGAGRREGRAARRRACAGRGGHHLGEGGLLAAEDGPGVAARGGWQGHPRHGQLLLSSDRYSHVQRRTHVNFDLPDHLPPLLERMDAFIEAEIVPLQEQHKQFFDERREFARTDLDRGGLPSREWEELLTQMRRLADAAGWLRYGLPAALGGQDGSNLDMAVIREHLAARGLGLHNDLQDESSIVGNFPLVIMMDRFGTDAQRAAWTQAMLAGERSLAFGLTEPEHGTDATWLETTADARRRRLAHQRRQAVQHRRAPGDA